MGERAIALASELGEQSILVNALTNVGSVRLIHGDESGRALLERSLELARQAGFEDEVARALTNLSSAAYNAYRLDDAERYATEGLRYTGERDLLTMERFFRTQRVRQLFVRGAWDVATGEAVAIVQDPASTSLTRGVALVPLGRIRACRGEDAWDILDEALSLAEATGELQRLGPIRIARAEAAWLAGDNDRTADEAARGLELAVLRGDRWLTGELAVWLHRSGHRPVPPLDVAEPFALELASEWVAAARYWDDRGCLHQAARVKSEAGDESAVRAALATFERLGARPDAARATRRLRALGARSIPRGPNRATRVNPGLLTEREVEVLSLVAAGKSNREIAERLYLSQKTAGHHVSAILAKLGVASRSEAVDHALRLGLLPPKDRDADTQI